MFDKNCKVLASSIITPRFLYTDDKFVVVGRVSIKDEAKNLLFLMNMKAITFLCNPGKSYRVKITGAHDRLRIAGTIALTGQTTWDELLFANDTINGDYELDLNPKISNMIIVYVSNTNQTPNIEVYENRLFIENLIIEEVSETALPIIPNDKLELITNAATMPNIFVDYHPSNIVVSNSYITKSPLFTPEQVSTAVLTILPNTTYQIKIESGSADRWRIAVMNTAIDLNTIPTFASDGDPTSYIIADRIITISDIYEEIVFENTDGVQLFIYASASNQNPNLHVSEYEEYVILNKLLSPDSLPPIPLSKIDGDISAKIPFMETVSQYSSPNLPSVALGQPIYVYDTTISDIYGMFDTLVAENPTYITKTLLGNEPATNLPIYQYEFKPEVVTAGRDNPQPSKTKLPKILVVAGVHGIEKQAVWTVTKFFEDMCSNWQTSDTLEFFRNNVQFKVIPILNAWGYNNNNRLIASGLDLNREFVKTPENMALEALIYKNFIDGNVDADFLFDCHTMWPGKDRNTSWIMSPEGHLDNLSNTVIKILTNKWKKQYPIITYDGLLGQVGDPEYPIKGGMNSIAVVYAYNAGLKNAVWVESADHITYDGEPKAGEMTTNMYVDLFGNILVGAAVSLGASYK